MAASHNQPDATLHIATHLTDATLHIAAHLTDATLHVADHLTDATLHMPTCPHYTSTVVKFSFSCQRWDGNGSLFLTMECQWSSPLPHSTNPDVKGKNRNRIAWSKLLVQLLSDVGRELLGEILV